MPPSASSNISALTMVALPISRGSVGLMDHHVQAKTSETVALQFSKELRLVSSIPLHLYQHT